MPGKSMDTGNSATLARMHVEQAYKLFQAAAIEVRSEADESLLGRWVWVKYRGKKRMAVVASVSVEQGISVGVRIRTRRSKNSDPRWLQDTHYYWLSNIGLTSEFFLEDLS